MPWSGYRLLKGSGTPNHIPDGVVTKTDAYRKQNCFHKICSMFCCKFCVTDNPPYHQHNCFLYLISIHEECSRLWRIWRQEDWSLQGSILHSSFIFTPPCPIHRQTWLHCQQHQQLRRGAGTLEQTWARSLGWNSKLRWNSNVGGNNGEDHDKAVFRWRHWHKHHILRRSISAWSQPFQNFCFLTPLLQVVTVLLARCQLCLAFLHSFIDRVQQSISSLATDQIWLLSLEEHCWGFPKKCFVTARRCKDWLPDAIFHIRICIMLHQEQTVMTSKGQDMIYGFFS